MCCPRISKNLPTFCLLKERARAADVASGVLRDRFGCLLMNAVNQSLPARSSQLCVTLFFWATWNASCLISCGVRPNNLSSIRRTYWTRSSSISGVNTVVNLPRPFSFPCTLLFLLHKRLRSVVLGMLYSRTTDLMLCPNLTAIMALSMSSLFQSWRLVFLLYERIFNEIPENI